MPLDEVEHLVGGLHAGPQHRLLLLVELQAGAPGWSTQRACDAQQVHHGGTCWHVMSQQWKRLTTESA